MAHYENDSRVNGFHGGWAIDYDDPTRTLVVTAFQIDERNGDIEVNTPGAMPLWVMQTNGQERMFDLFTITAPSDGQPSVVNKGPQTFTNIRLKTIAQRGNGEGIEYRTSYTPPAR